MWKPIDGNLYTPEAFDAHARSVNLKGWKPRFVVLHNTSLPSLAQWPSTPWKARVQNLVDYYKGQHWSAGPHLFVSPDGIIGFTPLNNMGVHSPSWNSCSWGVEMVGEYMTEDPSSGSGLKVYNFAVSAVASMCDVLGVGSDTIKFHREDPKTTHKQCPGDRIVKAKFLTDVHNKILDLRATNANA